MKDLQEVRKRYSQGQLRVGFNLYPFELNGENKMENIKECCVCGKKITNRLDINNAFPLSTKDGDVCCSVCNIKYVIPARIKNLKNNKGE